MKMIDYFKSIPCPICGKLPYIQALYVDGEGRNKNKPDDYNEYKVHCPEHHLDCCDWKKTELEAWELWERRPTDTSQPDFCFNDNHFTIEHMSLDDMADFLYRWRAEPEKIMCKRYRPGCARGCSEGHSCNAELSGVPSVEVIKNWLKEPVDGLYPMGYPGVPKEMQNQDPDIYGWRKKQAQTKI